MFLKSLIKYKMLKDSIYVHDVSESRTPITKAPISGIIFAGLFTFLYMIIMPLITPELFKNMDNKQIAEQLAYVMLSLSGLIVLISYAYNYIVIHTVCKFNKNKTDANFLGLNFVIGLIIVGGLGFYCYYANEHLGAKGFITYTYLPLIASTIIGMNIFSYKAFHEIYKRDKDGNLIFFHQKPQNNKKQKK